MTESEWWAKGAAPVFWLFSNHTITTRKSLLFSHSCSQFVAHRMHDWPCGQFVSLLEDWADDRLPREMLPEVINSDAVEWGASTHVLRRPNQRDDADRMLQKAFDKEPALVALLGEYVLVQDGPVTASGETFLPFLHDIFGPLPFRDIAAHPSWLTTDVLALARGIYDDKAFDRMPILADALQDAGCDNQDILSHCRQADWEHVRGCWVIDLLLGRPWRESP